MASPEVCKALPTMTWSNSAGSTLLLSIAARAARAPSSMAERSRSAPPPRPRRGGPGPRAGGRRDRAAPRRSAPWGCGRRPGERCRAAPWAVRVLGSVDDHGVAFLAGFLERDFHAVDDVGDDIERVVIGPHRGFAYAGAEGERVLAVGQLQRRQLLAQFFDHGLDLLAGGVAQHHGQRGGAVADGQVVLADGAQDGFAALLHEFLHGALAHLAHERGAFVELEERYHQGRALRLGAADLARQAVDVARAAEQNGRTAGRERR